MNSIPETQSATVSEEARFCERLSQFSMAQQKAMLEIGVTQADEIDILLVDPISRQEFEERTKQYEAEAKQTELTQKQQTEVVRITERERELVPAITQKEKATLAVETAKTTNDPNAYKLAADMLAKNGLDPRVRIPKGVDNALGNTVTQADVSLDPRQLADAEYITQSQNGEENRLRDRLESAFGNIPSDVVGTAALTAMVDFRDTLADACGIRGEPTAANDLLVRALDVLAGQCGYDLAQLEMHGLFACGVPYAPAVKAWATVNRAHFTPTSSHDIATLRWPTEAEVAAFV